MFEGILDSIQKRIVDTFSGVVSTVSDFFYISEWFAIGLVIILACVAIGFFFTHPWVRACLGFVVWGVVTFLAGMVIMFKHAREKQKVEPPKPPKPPPPREREWHW